MSAASVDVDSQAADPRKWLTLAVVALGVLLAMADSTIVNLALPSIREDLGYLDVSVTELQWVVNAYVLTFAALLLTAGRLADLFGRRLLFVIGLVMFVASSIACGAADDVSLLIAFRAVQGVGAALLAPTSLSIVTAAFPREEHGLAIGAWSAIVGGGIAVGPLLGGVLAEKVDWRWVFYINVPAGVVALVGAFVWIRESRDPSLERRVDLLGVLTSSAALFALTFGLLKGNDYGWRDARTIGLLVFSAAALITFVLVERARRAPMLDLSLFRSRTFSGANATAVMVGFALLGFLFFFSLFTQGALGYSAIEAGASLLPMMVLLIVLAPIVGKLTDRIGPKWLLSGGMALLGGALLIASRLDFNADFWDLFVPLAIGGVGFSLVLTPLTAAALSGVPARDAGMGAAVINTTRQTGGSLGIAILGAISTAEINGSLREGQAGLEGFVDGFKTISIVAAGVTLFGAVIAALTVKRRAAEATGPQERRAPTTATWAVPPIIAADAARESARAQPSATRQAEGPRPALQIVAGPAAGSEIAVGLQRFVFGRSESGPGRLADDPELSRRHAGVSLVAPGRLLVEDLGSSNGTFVNDERITAPTIVEPGDVIRMGTTVLNVLPPASDDRGKTPPVEDPLADASPKP